MQAYKRTAAELPFENLARKGEAGNGPCKEDCHPERSEGSYLTRVIPRIRLGGALRAPRRQSLLRSQARCAFLPAATPRVRAVRARKTVIGVTVAGTTSQTRMALNASNLHRFGHCGWPAPREAPIMRGVAAGRSAYARSAGAATGGGGRAALP